MSARTHVSGMFRCLAGAMAGLLFSLLLPGCPDVACSCDWEGPVDWTLTKVQQDGTSIYLSGTLRWEPCCEEVSTATVAYRLDLAECDSLVSGTILKADLFQGDVPGAATELALPEEVSKSLTWTPGGCDSSVVLYQMATDSLLVEWLTVGQILTAAGVAVRDVQVPTTGIQK